MDRLANLMLRPKTISVGGVQVEVNETKSHLIPILNLKPDHNLQDLRWILQKITLSQDLFLLSTPGNSARNLVLYVCEILGLQASLKMLTILVVYHIISITYSIIMYILFYQNM